MFLYQKEENKRVKLEKKNKKKLGFLSSALKLTYNHSMFKISKLSFYKLNLNILIIYYLHYII